MLRRLVSKMNPTRKTWARTAFRTGVLFLLAVVGALVFDAFDGHATAKLEFTRTTSPDGAHVVIEGRRSWFLGGDCSLWIADAGESDESKWHRLVDRGQYYYAVTWSSNRKLVIGVTRMSRHEVRLTDNVQRWGSIDIQFREEW